MAFFAAAALTPSVAAMVRPPPAPSVRPRGWGVSDVAAHAAATSVGPRHVAAARQVAPRRASSSSSPATRRSVVRRAEGADEDAPAAPDEERPRPTEEDDEEVKGAQMTAIVTGAVSVILAVGYLALVQVMDSREMLPPPPEAMGMGDVR